MTEIVPTPYRNSENYVWFALEKYFKWKCQRHAASFNDPLLVPALGTPGPAS